MPYLQFAAQQQFAEGIFRETQLRAAVNTTKGLHGDGGCVKARVVGMRAVQRHGDTNRCILVL